jgi:hypothetical protein
MNCRHKWAPQVRHIQQGRIVREICVCEKCGLIRREQPVGDDYLDEYFIALKRPRPVTDLN